MSLLTISDLTLRIAGRTLLDSASLNVDPGRKIGLVGRNGAGKSTLLAAIAGDITADGGTITLANRATMGRVKQETPSGDTSLIDTVLEGDLERTRLLHAAETETDPTRIADVHERLIAIDAYTAPARAGAILSGLGFDQDAQLRSVSDFSGGWRMRVSLATALFLNPDLLLLDEPTNHLDIEAVLWLESWLAKFSGAAIIVSHDRSLLDNTVDAIAHLDRGTLNLTPGGYDNFIRIRTEQALQQNRMAERVATQRAHMQSFVDRFRAQATKARQAQARIKALEKLPQIDSVVEDSPTRFNFPEPAQLPPPMLTLDHVTAGYGDHIVLSGLNQRLDMEDRIALLGQNGRGKSTFAKILAGRLAPLEGSVKHSPKLRIGYFAQHQSDELVLSDTPIDHMTRAMPDAKPVAVRAQLDRFGLDAQRAETRVGELSGGEKARLLLALATREAPHLLLLDEPTNHLDLDARDALIRALAAFEGAVILISHDSHLVESVADRFWLVEDGTITPFDGDMAEYKTWLIERARKARSENNERARSTQRTTDSTDKDPAPSASQRRADRKELTRALAPLRRKIKDAETKLAQIAKELASIETKLADPNLYQSGNPADIASLNAHRAGLEAKQAEIEEIWLEAQAELEEAST
ncbi:ABC-F family ATP-binding cassette domain-containing protein [Neokomagataea thailandica]|uniref:ABC transporter ATP-binding protein n=1 Tax=Neokomagataea tanensis NBRC 106556 TaxID=1223519 RepID=A0ABQ0QG23_9PROT|nr:MULTISPECIES: ABC-F family ATP-binding cassette domain-containing protein [Neokomagataea]GBR43389.1 ABC transporter ATP-binding protein [Neokomagataea tanensis NBRC 106556]